MRDVLYPSKMLLSCPSKHFLKDSPIMDSILAVDLTFKEFLFFKLLLQGYFNYIFLPSKRETKFSSLISLRVDPVLEQFSCRNRSKYLQRLHQEGLIVKEHTRGAISFYITEHYLAIYFFFLSISPKVAGENFELLKEKVGEIMRKRPNYQDAEEILNACIERDSAEEAPPRKPLGEESADKKRKLLLKKPKAQEQKESNWINSIKSALKLKSLSYGAEYSTENLSKNSRVALLRAMPEDDKLFKEKAEFAADAFVHWTTDSGRKCISINAFSNKISSWIIDGYSGNKKGKSAGAVWNADRENIRKRNEEHRKRKLQEWGEPKK